MTTSKVLVTAGNKVYSSTNGGQSFAEVISTTLQASTQGLNSIYLDEEGYGYAVGDNGAAFRIEPSSTYTKVATDATPNDDKGTGIPQVNLAQVQFTDRYTGYITADGGLLLKTIDGGAHWKQEQTGTTAGVPILAMSVDRSTGTLIAGNSVQQLKDESQKFNSRFWYDELGRLVLSQNAKQFKTNTNGQKAYSYTLYDPIGRITEVGELLTTAPVTTKNNDFQVAYAAHTNFVTTGTRHQVTRTKYDNNDNKPEGFEPKYLRNRVAYTTYKQEEDAPQQETHYSYDVHGNVKQLMQVIRSNDEQLTKTVDYEYDLVSGKVNKVYYQKAQADQFIHTYNYDGDNRITKVETSTDDIIYTQEATYQYYAHGPLARTKLGEDGKIETQDYAYTIQGWIKQVQGNAFGYALGYNGTDYSPIGTSTNTNNLTTPIETGKDLYNGNIATMTSLTPEISTAPWVQQFTYDQLNRIKTSATPGSSQYATSYNYDANGNILNLTRKDETGNDLDNLVYTYETKANGYQRNTNKLRSLNDAVMNSAHTSDIEDQSNDNYSYDAIGNLISDRSEEIENIEWSVSGKVLSVIRTEASTKANLTFDYDASGQRIAKHVHEKDGTVKSTYYVRDASGNVMSVYRATSTQTASVKEQYIYGSSRIGVYNAGDNNSSNSHTLGLRHYELTDHLGNVRVVLSDYQQDIISASDYYPFGMEIEGRRVLRNEKYRYGFNGKELDSDDEGMGGGGSTYDYGFRIYNPNIAKFLSIDPLSPQYPWYTPYQFAGNKPINCIDLDGLEEKLVILNYSYVNIDGEVCIMMVQNEYTDPTFIENYMVSKGLSYIGPVSNITYLSYQSNDPNNQVTDQLRSQFLSTETYNSYYTMEYHFDLLTGSSFEKPGSILDEFGKFDPPGGQSMHGIEGGPGSGNVRYGDQKNTENSIDISMLESAVTGMKDCAEAGAILVNGALEGAWDIALKLKQILDRQQNMVEKSQQAAEEYKKTVDPVHEINQGLDGGERPANTYPYSVEQDKNTHHRNARPLGDSLIQETQYDENFNPIQTDTLRVK